MALVVLQPHGLGDHIFCMSLVYQIADRQEIIWPVLEHFIPGLRFAYPEINWIPTGLLGLQIENHKRIGQVNGHTIAPIRWADQLTRKPYKDCMRSKYDLYGLDWNTWKDFDYKRDLMKEKTLFNQVLGLRENEPYRLINRRFTSLETKSVAIPHSKEIRNIEMQSFEGFSLFDWSMVIAKATEIHTVSTSLLYLFEMLPLCAEEVHLYCRKPDETNFENVEYIFTKNYKLHL